MSAQETNQRKRLGDALTAKPFGAEMQIQHGQPDFEPPSPRPPPGPRRGLGAGRICSRDCLRMIDDAAVGLGESIRESLLTIAGRGT